jgi:hypothetical protein
MTISVAVMQNFENMSDKFNVISTPKKFFQNYSANYFCCVIAACKGVWKVLVKWQHTSDVCSQSAM